MKFLGISAAQACFFFLLVFSTAPPGYAGDEAPVLFYDFAGRSHNVADGTIYVITSQGDSITQYAIGGSSDGPGADLGRLPWRKTGNVRYVWFVQGDGGMNSVDDGETTVEPSSQWFLDFGGNCTVSASLQAEYEDSSDPPARVYWPR